MFTLTALVLSLSPVHVPVDAALGQAKIQIIKGKRGTVKAANAGSESAPQTVQEVDSTSVRNQQLNEKEAQLNAREQALEEKQAAAAENEEKKAEQQKKLQKQVEKIGEANRRMWQGAANDLAGE